MTEFSRTKKYQDLRDRLQNDTGSEVLGSNELSVFDNKLKQIDSSIYDKPIHVQNHESTASHARIEPMPEPQPVLRRSQPKNVSPAFDADIFSDNENTTSNTFDNDYLDQYIREVKQYNIDQGNAETENTQVNILRQLQRNQTPQPKAPTRPYPKEEKHDFTPDIPFRKVDYGQPITPKKQAVQPADEPTTQNLSKEDIMAEVQNMVNGSTGQTKKVDFNDIMGSDTPFEDNDSFLTPDVSTDTFKQNFEKERLSQKKLIEETTKLRITLDEYEENLNEMNDKVHRTNQIMNAVLIAVIISLLVVLCIVIYFIVITKGAN